MLAAYKPLILLGFHRSFHDTRTSSSRAHSAAPRFQLRPAALGSQLVGRPAGGIFLHSEILISTSTSKTKGYPKGCPETVEKVANATFSSRPHEISGSISCEIVAQNFVRGVISQAHVLGNDWISFYSAAQRAASPLGFQCSESALPTPSQGFRQR